MQHFLHPENNIRTSCNLCKTEPKQNPEALNWKVSSGVCFCHGHLSQIYKTYLIAIVVYVS